MQTREMGSYHHRWTPLVFHC